ncbi:MAG TPA: NTF2 fold immunity protein [Herpetosiphonaceae bacterium]
MTRPTQHERAAAILQRITLTDADIDTLSQLQSVRALHFAPGTTFPPRSFVRLARLRWLQFLTVEASTISGQDMQDLGGIVTLRSLIFLRCRLGDAEVQQLTAPPRLERLFLAGSQITDASLPHIAAMSTITWLSLEGTDITNAGLAHLAAMRQLEILYLDETSISDAGVLFLASIPHLRMGQPTALMTHDGMATFRAAQRAERTRQQYGTTLRPMDAATVLAVTNHLTAFFHAMYGWGLRAIALSDAIPPPPRSPTAVADAWQQMRDELSPIIAAFCTPPRPRGGKPAYFSVSQPPEYDPTSLVIGDIIQPDTRTVIIMTEEIHGREYEYVLKRRGGQWFIDQRRHWDQGRWRRGDL